MKRILITGASGFVGRHLVAHLAKGEHELTLLDREPVAVPGVRIWNADILADLQAFQTTRFDAIVHLAALIPHQETAEEMVYRVNVEGTRNILQSFAREGTQVVFFSTGLVYGPDCDSATEDSSLVPQGVYERSKLIAERVVQNHTESVRGIATILRPSVLYGEGASAKMFLVSMLHALCQGHEFPMTAGEQWRDFLHVRDAVKAIALVLETQSGGVFNLSSGVPVTIAEVAEYVGRLTGRANLIQRGKIPYRNGEAFRYSLNSDKLQKACGWEPSISLEDGIQELWMELCKRSIA